MRAVVSAILLGIVGFWVGGIIGGLCTLGIFFLGSWIGAPVGCAVGAQYGWRCPLRDATIIFVSYFSLFALACWQCSYPSPSDDSEKYIMKVAVWGLLIGPGGLYIPRLPVRWLSFRHRRVLALVLATLWLLVWSTVFYLWLWVWNP